MSIKKMYYKTKETCKVTFRVLKDEVQDVQSINLVGDFNNWDAKATPFKKFKNGNFEAIVELKKDKEFQFRYFADDGYWLNDKDADKFIPTPFGNDKNCVISV